MRSERCMYWWMGDGLDWTKTWGSVSFVLFLELKGSFLMNILVGCWALYHIQKTYCCVFSWVPAAVNILCNLQDTSLKYVSNAEQHYKRCLNCCNGTAEFSLEMKVLKYTLEGCCTWTKTFFFFSSKGITFLSTHQLYVWQVLEH